MPEPAATAAVVTAATAVSCAHGAIAVCAMPNQNWVRIDGDSVLTEADSHGVSGCMNAGGRDPCVLIKWTNGSTRLSIDDERVLLLTSTGTCFTASGSLGGTAKINTSTAQSWVLDE